MDSKCKKHVKNTYSYNASQWEIACRVLVLGAVLRLCMDDKLTDAIISINPHRFNSFANIVDEEDDLGTNSRPPDHGSSSPRD